MNLAQMVGITHILRRQQLAAAAPQMGPLGLGPGPIHRFAARLASPHRPQHLLPLGAAAQRLNCRTKVPHQIRAALAANAVQPAQGNRANARSDISADPAPEFFPQFGGDAFGHKLLNRPAHLRHLAH